MVLNFIIEWWHLYWFKEIVFPFCFWYFQIVCRISALWFKYFVCHHRADSSPAGALWCDVVLTHQHLNVNMRFCFFFKQSDSMHAIIHSWNVRNICTKYSQKCVICHKLCRKMSLAALRKEQYEQQDGSGHGSILINQRHSQMNCGLLCLYGVF